MKRLFYLFIVCVLLAFQPTEAQSIKSIGKSKVAAAQAQKNEIRRKAEEKRKEEERRQQEAQAEAEKKSREERQAYESACRSNSRQTLESFLYNYPYSQYASDVKERIQDLELWSRASQANTVSSYQEYLYTSKILSNQDEAQKRINDLRANQEWERIRYSSNQYDFEQFITSYPNSPHKSDASKRIHELKGLRYYNSGNLQSAYDEFNLAGGRYALDYSNRSKYNDCEEYVDYTKLSSYSSESDLSSFLSKYPTSKYRKEIMNALAIAKARNLSIYSGDYQYNEALSYAQDKETRSIVKGYIKNIKKVRKNSNKQYRPSIGNHIKNNDLFSLGIDLWDIGTNVLSSADSRYWHTIFYDFALSLRIGNYKSPVSFEAGIRPGWLRWVSTSDDEGLFYNDADTKFHMPVFAKLKVNLFEAWGGKKFYLNCAGFYHALRHESLEPKFSAGGGFGFAGEHWDWQILYYRQGVDNDYIYNKSDMRYWGTSLGYFFSL